MDLTWTILIYTVPAAPSRKRAAIWRALKGVGAIYLRDGVCVLPARDGASERLRAIAARVEGFDGQATLVEAARLEQRRAEAIVARSRADRADEYAAIAREVAGLLDHLRRETAHRAFTVDEVRTLAMDLDKLRRWADQVRARDYFGEGEGARVEELLGRCTDALATFSAGPSHRDEVAR